MAHLGGKAEVHDIDPVGVVSGVTVVDTGFASGDSGVRGLRDPAVGVMVMTTSPPGRGTALAASFAAVDSTP
jgi:hypothetical protein